MVHDAAETFDLGGEDAAAQSAEAIVSAARGVVFGPGGGLLYESRLHEALQVVVKGAGAQLKSPFRLARHFLHDGVAVHFLTGEGEQNMQGGRSEREEVVGRGFHYRIPLYQIPMVRSRLVM
jgi:hypothetical protein